MQLEWGYILSHNYIPYDDCYEYINQVIHAEVAVSKSMTVFSADTSGFM